MAYKRRRITPQRGWVTLEGALTHVDDGSGHTNTLDVLITHDELVEEGFADLTGQKADWFIKRVILQGYVAMAQWNDITPSSTPALTSRGAAVALGVYDFGSLESTNENPEEDPIFSADFDKHMVRVLQRHVVEASAQFGNYHTGGLTTTSTTTGTYLNSPNGAHGPTNAVYLDIRPNCNLMEGTGLAVSLGSFGVRGGVIGWLTGDTARLNYGVSVLVQKRRGA